jgi:hypothetical protein
MGKSVPAEYSVDVLIVRRHFTIYKCKPELISTTFVYRPY